MDKKTLMYVGLGLELPGLIIAFIFAGKFFDEKYNLKGMGIAGGALLGLVSWVLHLVYVMKAQDSDQ